MDFKNNDNVMENFSSPQIDEFQFQQDMEDMAPKAVKEEQVNQPRWYDFFDIKAMDVIEKSLSTEELIGFWKGSALKYRLRAGKKDTVFQDIQKAMFYENLYNEFKLANTPK